MENVFVFDHPLIQHKLALIRDENTGSKEFRELVEEVAVLMAYEVTRRLPLEETEVKTPVGPAKVRMLCGKKLGIVPILRAGLGMVNGMLKLIPAARVGHIGLYRDPDTLMPVEYYCKLPLDVNEREMIILDPMLATGGSAAKAVEILKEKGANNINHVPDSCTRGIDEVHKQHPDVEIYMLQWMKDSIPWLYNPRLR